MMLTRFTEITLRSYLSGNTESEICEFIVLCQEPMAPPQSCGWLKVGEKIQITFWIPRTGGFHAIEL